MTDKEKELERQKRLKREEGEQKLQHALKHQLGILTVGNQTFQDLIYNGTRYGVGGGTLKQMKDELMFLITCIEEMEEWIRMFREEGNTDFYSYRRRKDAGNNAEDNPDDYENNLYHLFNETPTKFL